MNNNANNMNNIACHYISAASIFTGNMMQRFIAPFRITLGLLQALFIYLRNRPDMVIGFGGYPAFAPLLAARLLFIPIALHEQNAVMGRANRMLARLGAHLAVSYADTRFVPVHKRAVIIVTGNPVRREVRQAGGRPYRPAGQTEKFNLLIFGGSQGARIFSQVLPDMLAALPPEKQKRLRLVQQCRRADMPELLRKYGALQLDAELRDFFSDMPQRMMNSHLIICRAGAASVCEIAALGRPAILVPLPGALDQDQTVNAARLTNREAALLLMQSDMTPARLCELVEQGMDNPQHLADIAARAAACGILNADEKLADFAESCIADAPSSVIERGA